MSFFVVIPARLNSSRLSGKVLLDIAGKPMLQHVYEQAKKSLARDVFIATDHEDIKTVATQFGARVYLTDKTHTSGTDRIAQVVHQHGFDPDDIIVNVQGDEPLIPPELIDLVATTLQNNPQASMATLATPIIDHHAYFDPNTVKVVTDKQSRALYFSRASIPWFRDHIVKNQFSVENFQFQHCYKHVGLYAYRADFLSQYACLEKSSIELIESLEQLRVLWHGYQIQVAITNISTGIGVDTVHDLQKVRDLIASQSSA